MNLCKNDYCSASSGPQYQQVISSDDSTNNKTPSSNPPTPSSSASSSMQKPKSNNNNASGQIIKKVSSRYTGKIKALDGIWFELRNSQPKQPHNNNSDSSHENNNNNNYNNHDDVDSSGAVSCLPLLANSNKNNNSNSNSLLLGKGNNGFRIDCTQLGPIQRKGHQRIISIKSLFSTSPKFVKNFSRGIFLSCLIYSEDKILVTLDDALPTFQIDDDLTCNSFHQDFHWLHKVSFAWADARYLKQEMEKCDSASTLHFRLRLLSAIVLMQDALEFRDLGKLFYRPLTYESNNGGGGGVTFICTVNHIRSQKLLSASNVRWIPIDKFKAKKPINDAYQVLSSSYQNLMLYHQLSNIPLGKGLYLGYFKLVTSVDLLKVIVPEKTPSIIPHVKIRSSHQLTKEELEMLATEGAPASESFKSQLETGLKKLFSNLKLDRNSALNHRFLNTEVIEISSSVNFIVILPPVEATSLLDGDTKELKWRESCKLIAVPIQIFEMNHLLTYHNVLARRLMRLSSTIEVGTALAQHNRRKAFSTEEMSQTQGQVSHLTTLQSKLETTWKECRWILEVVKAARVKDNNFLTIETYLSRNKVKGSPSKSSAKTSKPGKKSPLKSTKGIQPPFTRLQLQQLLANGGYHDGRNGHENNCSGGSDSFLLEESEDDDSIHFITSNTKLPSQLSSQSVGMSGQIPGGSSIPSNPNFKYESCSSLPIVGNGRGGYQKLRSTSSLFDMKMGPLFPFPMTNKDDGSRSSSQIPDTESHSSSIITTNSEDPDTPPHYQNIQELHSNDTSSVSQPFQTFQNAFRPPIPMQSSRSKLVSLTTMTNRLKGMGVGVGSTTTTTTTTASHYSDHVDRIPGTSDPIGLTALSWTKQRTSLDHCSSSASSTSVFTNGIRSPNDTKVIQVFAAYDCGLSSGTCVRLEVNWDTTARQVIHSLVANLKGKVGHSASSTEPGFSSDLENFCLVSVIGARERVLRMDYKPLRLQKPWDTARLFVRKRDDVTAAVSLENNIF